MIRRLCGIVTLNPASGISSANTKKSRSCGGDTKHRHMYCIQSARLKCAIVHLRRNRMSHGVGDHCKNFRRLGELIDAIERPQLARIHLPIGCALGMRRCGIGKYGPKRGRQHPRRETYFTHRQRHQRNLRAEAAGCQNAARVGRLPRRGYQFVNVRRNVAHPLQYRLKRWRGFKMMPRNHQVSVSSQRRAPCRRHLRGFYLDIHCPRAGLNGSLQNIHLLFDAAIEPPVVLMPPAGRQNGAVRIAVKETFDRPCAGRRVRQVVKPKFEKTLACPRPRGEPAPSTWGDPVTLARYRSGVTRDVATYYGHSEYQVASPSANFPLAFLLFFA